MGIPKGTKLTENPKSSTFKLRLDEVTIKKLNYLAEKTESTKSEIIRRGIDIQYNKK